MNYIFTSLVFLALGSACYARSVADCKTMCKEIRQSILSDVLSSSCKQAANIAPVPKLFQACIDGRKKGFNECVSVCSLANDSTSKVVESFEGCKSVTKMGNGPRIFDWCRRGYDEILSKIETTFVQHLNSTESLPNFELENDDVRVNSQQSISESEISYDIVDIELQEFNAHESNDDDARDLMFNDEKHAEDDEKIEYYNHLRKELGAMSLKQLIPEADAEF